MLHSTDRILATHAGSLPRPADRRAMVVAKAAGEAYDAAALDRPGRDRYLPRIPPG